MSEAGHAQHIQTWIPRFIRYLDAYAMHMTPEEKRAALSRYHESPETAALLPAFLRLVFGDRHAPAVVAIPQGDRS